MEIYGVFRHSSTGTLHVWSVGFKSALADCPFGGDAGRTDGFVFQHSEAALIAVPVFQVTLAVVVALFVIQMVRRLTAQSENQIAQGVSDGLGFLTA